MHRFAKGSTFGVFSSSYPITAIAPDATEHAISFIESQGYRVKRGMLTGKRDFYRSGTIAERAAEFNALLRDPEVDVLMATVGGFVSNALLPYIDYDAFARDPKPVVGHSDVTALLLALYQKTGVVTYYGPNLVTTFAQEPPFLQDSLRCLEMVLTREDATPLALPRPEFYSDEPTDWAGGVTKKQPIPNQWLCVQGGTAEGRLLGGNLNTLNCFMASPYMPEFREGDILFLEDTEKWAAYSERYYSMMDICGVFDKISGIILGKHRKFDDQGTGRTQVDILLEVLHGRALPILAEVDCCHTIPMLTLPLGGRVRMDATRREITLL